MRRKRRCVIVYVCFYLAHLDYFFFFFQIVSKDDACCCHCYCTVCVWNHTHKQTYTGIDTIISGVIVDGVCLFVGFSFCSFVCLCVRVCIDMSIWIKIPNDPTDSHHFFFLWHWQITILFSFTCTFNFFLPHLFDSSNCLSFHLVHTPRFGIEFGTHAHTRTKWDTNTNINTEICFFFFFCEIVH